MDTIGRDNRTVVRRPGHVEEARVGAPRGARPARELKRYNLALPAELYDELQQVADQKQVTLVELLRKFIKLGLLATQLEDRPGAALLIRENGTDRQIVMI